MIGCLWTHVHKQPIIELYFESEIVLKFYNLEAWPRGYKTFGDQSQTHGEYVPESEFITEVIKRLRSFSCSTLSLTLSSKRHNLEQAPALAQRQSRNPKWPRTSDKNADEDKF